MDGIVIPPNILFIACFQHVVRRRANQIEIILSGSERASIPMVGALVPSVSKKLTQAGNKLCSSP